MIKPIASISKTGSATKKPKSKTQTKKKKKEEKKKLTDEEIWVSPLSTDYEDICKRMLAEAHVTNLEDPDFDYRNEYAKGQKLWYVYHNRITNTVTIKEIVVSTIYPRTLIGYVDCGEAVCIGYNEKDLIFETPIKAEECMKGKDYDTIRN